MRFYRAHEAGRLDAPLAPRAELREARAQIVAHAVAQGVEVGVQPWDRGVQGKAGDGPLVGARGFLYRARNATGYAFGMWRSSRWPGAFASAFEGQATLNLQTLPLSHSASERNGSGRLLCQVGHRTCT